MNSLLRKTHCSQWKWRCADVCGTVGICRQFRGIGSIVIEVDRLSAGPNPFSVDSRYNSTATRQSPAIHFQPRNRFWKGNKLLFPGSAVKFGSAQLDSQNIFITWMEHINEMLPLAEFLSKFNKKRGRERELFSSSLSILYHCGSFDNDLFYTWIANYYYHLQYQRGGECVAGKEFI